MNRTLIASLFFLSANASANGDLYNACADLATRWYLVAIYDNGKQVPEEETLRFARFHKLPEGAIPSIQGLIAAVKIEDPEQRAAKVSESKEQFRQFCMAYNLEKMKKAGAI